MDRRRMLFLMVNLPLWWENRSIAHPHHHHPDSTYYTDSVSNNAAEYIIKQFKHFPTDCSGETVFPIRAVNKIYCIMFYHNAEFPCPLKMRRKEIMATLV
eukprot:sb/3478820/